jgi:hypothetical protein
MAEVNGTIITFYQGDEFDMNFPVVSDPITKTPYDLTGGAATMTYWKDDEAPVDLSFTVVGTAVTGTFLHAATSVMSGNYRYQLRCRNVAGKQVMGVDSSIEVRKSKNPDSVSV